MTDVEREMENVMALLPQGSWRRFAMERVQVLMQAVRDESKAKIEALPRYSLYDEFEGSFIRPDDSGSLLLQHEVLATFSAQEESPKDIRETLIDPDTL
jgi:hypothetical protein